MSQKRSGIDQELPLFQSMEEEYESTVRSSLSLKVVELNLNPTRSGSETVGATSDTEENRGDCKYMSIIFNLEEKENSAKISRKIVSCSN